MGSRSWRVGVMRRTCLERGHKWRELIGIPYTYCTRWLCAGSAVSMWANPAMAVDLHNVIPRERRVPPVEIAEDGETVLEKWEEGQPGVRVES